MIHTMDTRCQAASGETFSGHSNSFLPNSFIKDFNEEAICFIAKLYDFTDVTRSRAHDILDSCGKMYNSSPVQTFFCRIIERLKCLGENTENIYNIERMLNVVMQPFKTCNSEFKCLKRFSEIGTYIPPQTIQVGEREDYRTEGERQVLIHVPITIEFIPLRLVLKQFLELPNMIDHIISYVDTLSFETDLLSNIVQGTRWSEIKRKFDNKFVLPLVLYYDDFETNNPLGTHRGLAKIGAIYVTIPCLPPEISSKLENIFTLTLFNTLDKQVIGFEIILSKAMEELKFLELEGIKIKDGASEITIFFALATVLGDNLGLNEILGYTFSFSANFCCRFCLSHHKDMSSIWQEELCPLRTNNYKQHLIDKNVSETGIQSRCTFSQLKSFDMIQSLSVDLMHDVLEGVCPYDLAKVLNYFVENSYFSWKTLNNRFNGFDYGPNEKRNKPGEITLKKSCKYPIFTLSSAEMLCFIRNCGLIIGDLIPANDAHWEIIIKLKELLDILMSKVCHKGSINLIKSLIREYLQQVIELFPNSLKPKHHFLLHYGQVLAALGPLWNISTINFERKHRETKSYTHVAISRVNVCHTALIKQQLKLNYRFLCKTSVGSEFEYTSIISHHNLQMLDNFSKFSSILPLDLNDATVTKEITYMGHSIVKGSILMTPSNEEPIFDHVQHIILTHLFKVLFVCRRINDCDYDRHFQAYEIGSHGEEWSCLMFDNLKFCTISRLITTNNKQYIPKRWI